MNVSAAPLFRFAVEDWDAVEGLLEYALGDRLMLPSTARAPKAKPAGAGTGGGSATHASGMTSTSASSSSSSSSASAASGGGGLADIDMSAHPFLLSEHVYASKADRVRATVTATSGIVFAQAATVAMRLSCPCFLRRPRCACPAGAVVQPAV